MKRCLALLLAIVTILLPCGITVNAEGDLSENSKNMITFIKEKNNNLLVSRNNYAYMKLGEKWYSDVGVNYCLKMADLLIDTGSCPNKEKYMEVLINIIATYDMDNAADLSSQKKQDNLKSIKDYAMDIAKMAGDAVSVHSKLKGIKGELSDIEDVLSKAIDGLGVLADNTNNWIDALTNLETFTQDFSNYNSFLKCIEENSEGELKDAAYTLRNSLKKSFLLKLEAYGKVSSDNYDNYTFFFFDDVFFDAAKMISDYETDDAYKFVINSSEGAWERFFILKGSWDLGKDIGKLVGNIVVGGEDLINRTLEIEALYDISVILQTKVLDSTTEFLSYSADSDADEYIDEYVTFANFLIGCRIRGEYCTYTILAEDSGLLALLSDKTDAQNWYDEQSAAIMRLRDRINSIKTSTPTNENTEEDWKSIYKAKLQEKANQYSGSEYDAKFELVDIDQNGIPELFISPSSTAISSCEVYTISGGSIKQLDVVSAYGRLFYNEKEKTVVNWNMRQGVESCWAAQLIDDKMKEIYSSHSIDNGMVETPVYQVNNKNVTAQEYKESNQKYQIDNNSDWVLVGRKYSLNSSDIDTVLGISDRQITDSSTTNNQLLVSDIIQAYNGTTYYAKTTAKGGGSRTIDFSKSKYVKYSVLPISENESERYIYNFLIFNDKVYYTISGQGSAVDSWTLKCCDLDGSNITVLLDDVLDYFEINNGMLIIGKSPFYSDTCYRLDMSTGKSVQEESGIPERIKTVSSCRLADDPTEFDGGLYYRAYIENSIEVLYYRKDINSGNIEKIGSGFQPSR